MNAQVRSSPAPRKRRRAGAGDLEAVFLRAGSGAHVLLGGGNAAAAGNVEIELAGRAHDERRADRNGDRFAGFSARPSGLARMHAGKNDRWLAGIGWRGDPGVDAEIRRQYHALPVEGRSDALPVLAAGGDEGGDHGDENKAAQRIRIARREVRRRPAGLERACRGERARDMGLPKRERIGILRRHRQFVGDGRRRPVTDAAAPIEPV